MNDRARPSIRSVAATLSAAVALVGCARSHAGARQDAGAMASPEPIASTAAPPPVSPAPLAAEQPIVPLDVEGFLPAVVSIPKGATGPKPIVVATHGLWDFPEGVCDNWRWIVGDRAWVLCPRGKAMPDKTFRYPSSDALTREIEAGASAIAARFPGYVDKGPMLYTGFSHGAIVGVGVVVKSPDRFPVAIFTEGGEEWTPARARAFVQGGGKRVLFACGLRGRVPSAERAAKTIERAGGEARVVLGKLPDTGQYIHWYGGPVAEQERAQLGWLTEGDSRWAKDGL